MTFANQESGTNAYEIADGIYRINTPVDLEGINFLSTSIWLEMMNHCYSIQVCEKCFHW